MLVHFLKDKYKLSIVGTKVQQTGVGGKLTLGKKVKWQEASVDGIRAIWVAGTPCDAIEFAEGYFKKPTDLVISGINLGANIGGSVMTSGTYAAAYRALNLKLVPHAIAISWNLPAKFWFKPHNIDEDLKPYHDYPGKIVSQILDLTVKNNF